MSTHVTHVDPASADAGFFLASRETATEPVPAPVAPGLADPRHLLGLAGMARHEIVELLDRAAAYRAAWRSERRLDPDLDGVETLLAFFEDSTRTRVSFELAASRLGGRVVTIVAAGSSVSKGESLLDTLYTLTAMGVDLVVMRHASSGAAAFAARHLAVGVINGGDGAHEHPTQGLLDLLTLRDAWGGRIDGRQVAIVGDVAHSRVARSAIFGLTALGARVTVAGPPTLIPRGVESLGCTVAPALEDAMRGADAVMALRLQRERMASGLVPSMGAYARDWAITRERVGLLSPGGMVMHPGPMNRGVEIAPEVADGDRSVVLDQVANGVWVRCAVLVRCAAAAGRVR